jgi:hypothetical protein
MSTIAQQTASQIVTVENAAGHTSASVRQTTKATEQIIAQISEIQAVTEKAASAIREISQEISECPSSPIV